MTEMVATQDFILTHIKYLKIRIHEMLLEGDFAVLIAMRALEEFTYEYIDGIRIGYKGGF